MEAVGLSVLAGGLFYSIVVFILNQSNYKLHFVILTFVIFIALFLITGYKYLMYRWNCEKMNNIIIAMKKRN